MDIARAGDRAVLVQLDPGLSAAELHAAARSVRGGEHVLACIVGHSSLYVIFDRDGRLFVSTFLQPLLFEVLPDGSAVPRAVRAVGVPQSAGRREPSPVRRVVGPAPPRSALHADVLFVHGT